MLGYSNTGKGKTLLLFFPEAIAFDVIAALVLDVRVPTLRGKFTRMKNTPEPFGYHPILRSRSPSNTQVNGKN